MSTLPITTAQLHDPILPYVRQAPLVLHADATIGDALERARALPPTEIILYCYVVDAHAGLVGEVSVQRLLTSPIDAALDTVATDHSGAIPSWATVLVAAEYFVNRRLFEFPVVEPDGRFIGVVDVTLFNDDVLTLARETFDGLFQISGVHATQGLTPWTSYKDRFPWLLSNVGGGLLCALLVSRYESLLDVAVVLALFIPVVLALSESVSIQSVTLTLQNLQGGGIHWRVLGQQVLKEAVTAAMLGLSCGGLIGVAAWIWQGSWVVGIILAGAIGVSMTTACLLGVILPTALHALNADPRIAAGPVVLALADLATLLCYFTLAARLL